MEAFLLDDKPLNHETAETMKPPKPIKPPKAMKPPKPIKPPREIRPNNHKPKDPDYFKKYYHQNVKQTFECPYCNAEIVGNFGKLLKHQSTKACQRVQVLAQIDKLSYISFN